MKPFKWLARCAGKRLRRGRKVAPAPNPQQHRDAVRKSLSGRLSDHLIKDVGGEP
ncbi:hypothetical protein WNY37_00920 [Henriciella sp. AS95]|uniref:hypothetical protein n=1 Tax=Henriciella sp. AS95 TaxID=3135782 RepID=UPI00316FC055